MSISKEKLATIFKNTGEFHAEHSMEHKFLMAAFATAAVALPFNPTISLIAGSIPTAYYGLGKTLVSLGNALTPKNS